jgi:UDP-N-acetylglucosamine--N-acetylmuramyl-(pentapeptide) pyrophosphoryl-undecaprenol N-acetylglucosamine transferase
MGEEMSAAVGTRSVMLAAGGTGGHLFPAFALAQELGRRAIAVDLVTDMRGDRYGSDFPARAIYRVPSATLASRSPVAAAGTAWMLLRGIAAAYRLLGQVRPGAVVGFGGYPAFPPLLAATLRHIPTALHEQNAVLGRANRMLAKRVNAIATSFEHTRLLEGPALTRARLTGNPVRDQVIEWSAQSYLAPLGEGPFSLLVFGGSQGARFFSDALPPALALLPAEIRASLFVVQQCREEDLARVEAAYRTAGVRAHLATFFANLPEEMAKAHLVIGRAGASTVAELTVMGRPAILVPLPHSIDNDQLQNATRLAESGAAWCIEQKELTPERLASALSRLLSSPQALEAAAAAAKGQGRPDAVVRLADLVEELVGRGEKSA